MNNADLLIVGEAIVDTTLDVLPIAAILLVFQLAVLRQKIPNLRRVLIGFVYVIIGLAVFLVGLEEALFPLGEVMAQQLTDPDFVQRGVDAAHLTDPYCEVCT